MSEAVQSTRSSGPPAKRMKTTPSELTIEKLPRDVLVLVMKYVQVAQWPSLEAVSRTFRDAVYEAWRTVRKIDLRLDFAVEIMDSKMSNLMLDKLTRRAPNISGIGGFGKLNKDSIDLLVRFEKLERVEFDVLNAPLNELGIFLQGSASRNTLKEVKATRFIGQSTPPDQDAFLEAFHGQNGLALKLEILDFSGGSNLGVSWIFLSAVDVSRLTSFNVIDSHVTRSIMVSFLYRATNLRRLGFSFDCCCDELVSQNHASEPGPTELVLQWNKKIIRAVAELENLVSLTMSTSSRGCGCRYFDDEMVRMVEKLGRRGNMEELSLWQIGPASPELTNCIATALPNLSSLEMDVGQCGEAALKRMLKAQTSLANLKLSSVTAPSTSVVPHITANALRLKRLNLRFAGGSISKEDLLRLGAFKQLKDLSVCSVAVVSNNNIIDGAVLLAWADAFASNLETLEFSSQLCGKITDEALLPLIKKAPRLRGLHMPCSVITDRSLKELCARCPNLRDLNVAGSPNITIEGVQAVISGCDYLEWLRVPLHLGSSKDVVKCPKYSLFSTTTTFF